MAAATDVSTLHSIYSALGGPDWQNSSLWLSDAPVCRWHGVVCADDGVNVSKLHLMHNNASGTIPTQIGRLRSLVGLFLYTQDGSACVKSRERVPNSPRGRSSLRQSR